MFDGTLFFAATDGTTGRELWTSDGTELGTVLFQNLRPDIPGTDMAELTPLGTSVFFVAEDVDSGIELWSSDGTAGGTGLVSDIRPGTDNADPYSLTGAGDTLFLQGCGRLDLPGSNVEQMWRTLTERLASIADQVVLYPGHDYSDAPSAPMGRVRQTNYALAAPTLDHFRRMMGG